MILQQIGNIYTKIIQIVISQELFKSFKRRLAFVGIFQLGVRNNVEIQKTSFLRRDLVVPKHTLEH